MKYSTKYDIALANYPKTYSNKFLKQWATYVEYPHWAKKQKSDIYHISDQSMGHVAKYLPQDKLVMTCNDLISLHFPERIRPWALALWKYSISSLKKAEHIIAISESTKQDLVNYLGIQPNHIDVIYMGAEKSNIAYSKDEIMALCGLSSDRFKLFCIGVAYYKNFKGVLKSVLLLDQFYHQLEIIKIGPVIDQEEIMLIGDLKSKGVNIIELGFVDNKTVAGLYKVADVLMFPSLYEGFGMPIVEAMLNDCPVITSNIASMPEVAGDAAILLAPHDYRTMADAIVALLESSSLRDDLIQRGRKRASYFTWEQTAEKTQAIYSKIG